MVVWAVGGSACFDRLRFLVKCLLLVFFPYFANILRAWEDVNGIMIKTVVRFSCFALHRGFRFFLASSSPVRAVKRYKTAIRLASQNKE